MKCGRCAECLGAKFVPCGDCGVDGQVTGPALSDGSCSYLCEGGAESPPPPKYFVAISRRSVVTAIDWEMFTDMNSDEREEAVEELERRATAIDTGSWPGYEELSCLLDEDEDGRPPLLAVDDLPDWLPRLFQAARAQTHDNWRDEIFSFDLLCTANSAAKDALEQMLHAPIRGTSDLVHVADGNKTIAERGLKLELYHAKPQEGSDGRLDKYEVPDSGRTAKLSATSGKGKAAYTASLFLYCDPYGSGLHNVVRTDITARIMTLEESVFNGDRPSEEEALAADPWVDR
jgi:hypothetical protein